MIIIKSCSEEGGEAKADDDPKDCEAKTETGFFAMDRSAEGELRILVVGYPT